MEPLRYKLIVQYDGTHFAGFQIQPHDRTVQGEIQRALKIMTKGKEVIIHGSGRTDSGVHAKGQVIHFDYPIEIPVKNMQRALNSLTTDEIFVQEVSLVDADFHARYNTSGKKYQYRVDLNAIPDPFKRLYTLHHPYPIDMKKLKDALKDLEGEHDFSSFCASNSGREDKVRTVYEASVYEDTFNNELVFTFRGNGFLYNMVRIFVGTLLQIANGLRPADEIQRLLEVKDRNQAGPTAKPQGLYLMEVYYDSSKAKKGTDYQEDSVLGEQVQDELDHSIK
ncbi:MULTISPECIES: tRNA pseudouridine(38-40) synthase TruA [Carnobacterium]|uniref:tRNA pseudouridine synthase A n=2 Tax=Carnobacterium inhibens TaxID=147709 RepID=U5SCA3_9LACT|nr:MULTISPECIES: tRNA pseudouridine(38-40) synthase TruA [Carnobacterium]AGY82646.1 tRNA pseudouridine synthase A [Carnobacterium inhibens subsp. gilichinskyi]MBC9825337.1 tRNA pseudouridine(38-40) synthase TruA [Carnobacterium inhibens]MCM3512268.1 tRNA pseudouridine(38-40) synthase TruA [Carnobacterium inhibens]MDN5371753.1 tRNA pseudouridine38-40 synthase [Carnobacterium sp.]